MGNDENNQLHINSRELLNDVLKNINFDIATLRNDFKKLNDLVIVINVKVEETKLFKSDLVALVTKIETIADKLYNLEKEKNKLESLISQVDKDNRSNDIIAGLTFDQKIKLLDSKLIELHKKIPLFKKLIALSFGLIAIQVYITESVGKFFDVVIALVKRFI